MSIKKLVFFYSLLLITIYSSAQKTIDKEKASPVTVVSAKDIEKHPFSRGINNFIVQQNFGYSRSKPDYGDNYTNNLDLKLDYNRFVVDHIGVGVELDLSYIKSEFNNAVSRYTNWIVYGNFIYGNTFNNNFNLYGKASVGFGGQKTRYTNSPSGEGDLFGYKFEVGSPIHLYKDGGNYITPFIRYDYLRHKFSGEKSTTSEFDFGFRFENYSICSGYQCDCSHGRSFSSNMYGQGRSFVGYSSMGQYGFGKIKPAYSNLFSEMDVSGGSFNLEYGYYITRDIALGGGLSWNGLTYKNDNGKSTNSALSFMPMITLNAPAKDCLENLFLQAGYGFGFQKEESGPIENKFNTTNLCINLGFNHFFGRHLAFTPKIGYEWETLKDKDTDIKSKQSGFEFGLGCSLHW